MKQYLLSTQWNHLLACLPLACGLLMAQDGLLFALVPPSFSSIPATLQMFNEYCGVNGQMFVE